MVASLDRFIKKRVMNKIFFMPKRSRLEVKKASVRLSDGKNKMATNGFNHLKAGQNIVRLDKKVRLSNG